MHRPLWTFNGKIDCFGIPAQQRDGILRQAAQEIWAQGGELQLRRLPGGYDTDRYRVHCEIPGDPRPLELLLKYLAALMPADHPRQELEGYDRANVQREDLVLEGRKLWRRVYQWQSAGESVVR